MKKVVHIIPVGHTKITLTEGMRQFPFHKIILVLGKEDGRGEKRAIKVAEDIKDEFQGLAKIEFLYVDIDDVYSAAIDMTKAIREEQKNGMDVKVSASGSLRTIGISCYLSCAVTRAELYIALPEYKDGTVMGIRQVLDVPSFPLKKIGTEELSILIFLMENGPVDTLDGLIKGMKPKRKGVLRYPKERARMSYHIKKLREEGFIDARRIGKNLRISLSKVGELYALGRG